VIRKSEVITARAVYDWASVIASQPAEALPTDFTSLKVKKDPDSCLVAVFALYEAAGAPLLDQDAKPQNVVRDRMIQIANFILASLAASAEQPAFTPFNDKGANILQDAMAPYKVERAAGKDGMLEGELSRPVVLGVMTPTVNLITGIVQWTFLSYTGVGPIKGKNWASEDRVPPTLTAFGMVYILPLVPRINTLLSMDAHPADGKGALFFNVGVGY